jgi:hypothetical protein
MTLRKIMMAAALLVSVAAHAAETLPHFSPDNMWHCMIVLPDISVGDKKAGVFATTLDGESRKTEDVCIQKAKEYAASMHGAPGGDLVCAYVPR